MDFYLNIRRRTLAWEGRRDPRQRGEGARNLSSTHNFKKNLYYYETEQFRFHECTSQFTRLTACPFSFSGLLPLFPAVAASACLTAAATASSRPPLRFVTAIFHPHRILVVHHRCNSSVFHHSSNLFASHCRRNFPTVAAPPAPSLLALHYRRCRLLTFPSLGSPSASAILWNTALLRSLPSPFSGHFLSLISKS
nr:hypothetical protein Itr_chr08CG08470 [Ipomoea trifida]